MEKYLSRFYAILVVECDLAGLAPLLIYVRAVSHDVRHPDTAGIRLFRHLWVVVKHFFPLYFLPVSYAYLLIVFRVSLLDDRANDQIITEPDFLLSTDSGF